MERIYADYNATEPVSTQHFHEVGEILLSCDANPSSSHSHGMSARLCVEKSRQAVAQALGVQKSEIYFTSGATESNNLVIHGIVQESAALGKVPHIITLAIEHASVFDPIACLKAKGLCTVTYLKLDRLGRIEAGALTAALTPETRLVAIMLANNEIGNIYPIGNLCAEVKKYNSQIHFHCDAVQGLGKLDLTDPAYSLRGVDSAGISGHKVGGLKGIGALYLRENCQLAAQLQGGGQERGLRPGTHNMPGIISLGLRCQQITQIRRDYDQVRVLKTKLLAALESMPAVKIHGDQQTSLCNTINLHVEGVAGHDLLMCFERSGISVSMGSACSAAKGKPGRVLEALGYGDNIAGHSVRISLGPTSKPEDVAAISNCLTGITTRRQASCE